MKCIIIGLGTYGRVMVDELSALGHEVIAADSDAGRVERVKDICDAAFQIDACDELALNVLPLKKVDVVIVAVGSNLGASVRVVALLKKLGVKHIYARANDYVHKSILQAFDIEKILIPEERAARSLVRQMDLGVKTDLFRIDDTYCVYKFRIPEKFVGLLVNDLHLYEEFHLKIIAVKKRRSCRISSASSITTPSLSTPQKTICHWKPMTCWCATARNRTSGNSADYSAFPIAKKQRVT